MSSALTVPPGLTLVQVEAELLRRQGVTLEAIDAQLAVVDGPRVKEDLNYFLEKYVQIHDATQGRWVQFHPYPAQAALTPLCNEHRQRVGLKARQLGITTYFCGRELHNALHRSHSTILLFSRRDEEAMDLLKRIKGMHDRLPQWLQGASGEGNAHELPFKNGSVIKAFPTGTGDSYTATSVLLDEFDVLTEKEQDEQMRSVQPTVDGGGEITVISRPDKTKPDSPFKRMYRAAVSMGDKTGWKAFFLPWSARPDRTVEWYERIKADRRARTGSDDELWEQYPATAAEALAEKQLDKRLPGAWLDNCFRELLPTTATSTPGEALALPDGGQWLDDLPGLKIFKRPEPHRQYVIGADPAEGLPNSDDSACEVLDSVTLEEVATLAGKFSPAVFAARIAVLSRWYNQAPVLAERNNHGHALILWLTMRASDIPLLEGRDNKPGWQTNVVSKALLYDDAAEVVREGACVLHDLETRLQLGSVEVETLSAPEGRRDDRSVAWVLAVCAAKQRPESVYETRDLLVLGARRSTADPWTDMVPYRDQWWEGE